MGTWWWRCASIQLSCATHGELERPHTGLQLGDENARLLDDAADAQHTAAQERAIAEAAQHELGNLLSSRDAAFQLQLQQQQGWKFRQLEFMTRSMHRLDALDTKFTALDGVCSSIIAAVGQQCQEQQDRLMYQLNKMVECQAGVCQLEATGDKINMLLACVQQQWAAKQQKLHASDKGMQVSQFLFCASAFSAASILQFV